MFDSAASRLKWFMLPSEALEVLNSNAKTASTIKAPRPFHVKKYVEEEENHTVKNFYPNSVPHQLVQSSCVEGDILSLTKCTLKSDESFQSNYSDLYYSSNDYDSDPEMLIAEGATVTGPSICFTAPTSNGQENSVSSVSESSTVPDSVQINSSPVILNGTQSFEITNVMAGNEINAQTTAVPYMNYTYSRTESTTSLMSQETLSQDGLSRHNSVDQYEYSQMQHYPQTGNYVISANVIQSSNPYACHNNNTSMNGYMEPTPHISFSYGTNQAQYSNNPSNVSSPMMADPCSPMTPSAMNTNPQQFLQSQQSVDMSQSPFPFAPSPSCMSHSANSDSGVVMGNEGTWGHLSSPMMTPSPVPCYNNQMTGGNLIDPNQNLQGAAPQIPGGTGQSLPILSPNLAFTGNHANSQSAPTLASPTNSNSSNIDNELVKVAMRRVTNEIANELKSEIRGVISQVEQGIDPDACRERANSFSSAKDKKMEALKKRARTMSGHVLRYKRSDPGDDLNPEDKSDTTDESSLASEGNLTNDDKSSMESGNGKSYGVPKKVSESSGSNVCCLGRKESGEKSSSASAQNKRPTKWHCPPKNIIKPTLTVSETI